MTTLGVTTLQITLLSGQYFQDDLQLYALGAVVLMWYTLLLIKPAIYVLSAPWIFFGLAFFLINLPSVSSVFEGAGVALKSTQIGVMQEVLQRPSSTSG